MSEDLSEQYVADLRGSLRGRPGKPAPILAAAEDHRRRPATVADLVLAACQAAGVYLLTVCAVSLVGYAAVRQAAVWRAAASGLPGRFPFATPRGYPGSPAVWLGCGLGGLALLGGCYVAHRVRRRRAAARGEVPGQFYPLATVVFCVALTAVMAVAGRAAQLPHGLLPWAIPAALVTGAGYILRMIGLTLAR